MRGVAGWYLANSQGMPVLVVAGLLVALAGLWWFSQPNHADVVQLRARNLPGAPKSRLTLHAGHMDGLEQDLRVSRAQLRCCTLSLPAAVFPVLAVLAVAMLAVILVPHARFARYNKHVLEALRAYPPVLTMPYDGQAGFHIGCGRLI